MAEAATQDQLREGPDQTFTIEKVIQSQEVENKKDASKPHRRLKVKFAEHPEAVVGIFVSSWRDKIPGEGDTVTGAVTKHASYGWQLDLPKSGGGGGGGRGRSPMESARIQRQHSQDMAIQFMRLYRDLGYERGSDEYHELVKEFVSMADSFDKDIIAGAARALAQQSTRVDSEGSSTYG